jgi:hypothetical protein
MTRILPLVVWWAVVLPMTMSGCGPGDKSEPPPGPSDAELAETIGDYCNTMVQCYPGTWTEPEHDTCVTQQEEQTAQNSECRKALFDYYECVVSLSSCLEVKSINQAPGTPCRDEFVASGELAC